MRYSPSGLMIYYCYAINKKSNPVWVAFLEATPRFELGVEVLQTFALPLGHVAVLYYALIL